MHFRKVTLNHLRKKENKQERGYPLGEIIGSFSPIWESSIRAISSRYKFNNNGERIHP